MTRASDLGQSEGLNRKLNALLMRAHKRAESDRDSLLQDTFVPVYPMNVLLENAESQILYGRRGTGKTHSLKHLGSIKESAGHIAIFADLRTAGSSTDIYNDPNLSLAPRATALLVDVIEIIHNGIYELLFAGDARLSEDTERVATALDALFAASARIEVIGEVESETAENTEDEHSRDKQTSTSLSSSGVSIGAKDTHRLRTRRATSNRRLARGSERYHIIFGDLSRAVRDVLDVVAPAQIWLLLDEWSSIPLELQPFLADMLRRNMFTARGFVVKIGAIERRSNFAITGSSGDYIGIELGADTSASLDIDKYLFFDNERTAVEDFFRDVLYKHVTALLLEMNRKFAIPRDRFIGLAFADSVAFARLVSASEGVPRDALNLAGLAASVAGNKAISQSNVYAAARTFFRTDKERKLTPQAAELLNHIIDRCVEGSNRVVALDVSGQANTAVVEELYDQRMLHRRAQGVAIDPSKFSQKFDIYTVDFGAFVDLIAKGDIRAVDDGLHRLGLVGGTGDVRIQSAWFVRVSWRDRWR